MRQQLFAALGYGTHGLHNNGGNFYSRAKVYDHMGFDSFTSKEFMNILAAYAKWMGKGRGSGTAILWKLWIRPSSRISYLPSVCRDMEITRREQLIENPKIKVEGIDDEAMKNKWEYYVNHGL